MREVIVPILLILLGGVWLLNNLNWLPDYYWFWTLGLIVGGIVLMVVEGITKSSIVMGPMLILVGVFSLLREGFAISWSIQLPILLMALGVLLLVSRLPSIPERRHRFGKAARAGSVGGAGGAVSAQPVAAASATPAPAPVAVAEPRV
jgi:membrane-bound ClpP family serine protease